jgi:serine/threonine protein kinase
MTWQPGTRLNQYKIDRVLGSGGFGITYKATHLALNQRVVAELKLDRTSSILGNFPVRKSAYSE